jgi:hypothetical protein
MSRWRVGPKGQGPASTPRIAWPIAGFVLVASEGAAGYRPLAGWDAQGRRAV